MKFLKAAGEIFIAEVFENTSKALIGPAIAFYFAAIVFLFIWMVLTGRRLFYIGTHLKD